MIYKYRKYTENSHSGTSLDIAGEAKYLGNVDSWDYAYLPEPTGQDERLQAVIVELTAYEKEELKKQRFVKSRKDFARLFIENEIGDIQDLIADAMKLIEFNLMLTARLAGDVWGLSPIDAATKQTYAERNKTFLDAVDAGQITLRGDFEDVNEMMIKMFDRVSKINNIVRDKYVAELGEVGL